MDVLSNAPAGTTDLGSVTIGRIGYGLAQVHRASDASDVVAVLRRAVELGVDHIDTASFYGAAEANALIREALDPYPESLQIVSKVGAEWVGGTGIPLVAAQRPEQLRRQVEIDLTSLGVERLAAVNLRRMDRAPGIIASGADVVPIEDQLAELVAMREEGLIGGVGVSNVTAEQLRTAQPAGIVCVQNAYSLLDRSSADVLEICRADDIAWVPYFPLGSGFDGLPSPMAHPAVQEVAAAHGATPAQVALAWLLAENPRTALIPGTGSVAHLEENVAAAGVRIEQDEVERLTALVAPGAGAVQVPSFDE